MVTATIAPTNGPSLNIFLNKLGFIAKEFHYDFYGPGEHRFVVIRPTAMHWPGVSQSTYEQLKGSSTITFVEEDDYPTIHSFLSTDYHVAMGVFQPAVTGHSKNLLAFVESVATE